MAEQSGFFDAHLVNGEYDRTYLSDSFAKYFASFIGNGVFGGKSNELMVQQKASADMSVRVLSGRAWINGYWYENSSDFSLPIDVADGTLNRTDAIVLRWDHAERTINLAVKKGDASIGVVSPSVQRDADYYELKLADVSVKAGATKITQSDIIDTRLNNEVCGLVQGVIQQFDTTEFGKQLDAYILEYATEYRAYLNELEITGTEELDALIARLNNLVKDESVVANLALEIDDAASDAAIALQTLGYEKKNLIPYPYDETTHNQGGISWVDNGDGTVTASGTSTTEAYFVLHKGKMPSAGKYFLSDGIGETTSKYIYALKMKKTDDTVASDMIVGNSSIPLEITESDIAECNLFIAIVIEKNVTISNVVFKPMLRRAEILDSTWEPYKLSVAELLSTPNKPGVEYLLAERWNGKPVYQKTLYVATLPNNSVVGIEVDSAYTTIVSINGYAIDTDNNYYHTFPIIVNGVTPIAAIVGFEGDGGDGGTVVIRTTTDATSYQAYITVKYTKD